jgi:hypothetical protein
MAQVCCARRREVAPVEVAILPIMGWRQLFGTTSSHRNCLPFGPTGEQGKGGEQVGDGSQGKGEHVIARRIIE